VGERENGREGKRERGGGRRERETERERKKNTIEIPLGLR